MSMPRYLVAIMICHAGALLQESSSIGGAAGSSHGPKDSYRMSALVNAIKDQDNQVMLIQLLHAGQ